MYYSLKKTKTMKHLILIISITLFYFNAMAQIPNSNIHTELVSYKDGDVELQGYLSYDETLSSLRPGVLVVHEWMGLNEYAKHRADMLAELGYVAFAVDIYGKNNIPTSMQEAATTAGNFKNDRQLLRRRILLGLDELKKRPNVDVNKIAAIGYCFGGTTVLELARSGADIKGVVSFHGGLDTPTPEDAKNIKSKVLVLTGGDDPTVPPSQVEAFEKEMRDANVDWQVKVYGGAVHSFSNPASGNDNSTGVAYNAKADKRSWEDMKLFFNEIFQ